MTDDLNLWTGLPAGVMPAEAYQLPVARLDILEEAIVYTRYDKTGQAMGSHQVSPADVAAALSGVPVTTGLLPQGTLFYARHAGGVSMGLYLAPRVYPVTVQMAGKRRHWRVPLPPLVFVGNGNTWSVFAVKQYPGETERLYNAPLPNVYTGGKICIGDVEFPACAPTTIRKAAEAFLASDFNTHLVQTRSKSHKENILELWQALDKTHATEYPVDDLVTSPYPGKLSDLIGGSDV